MAEKEDSSGSSWDHARAYASLLGTVPSSFNTAIRALKGDADKSGELSRGTTFQAGRLAQSPSLSACFSFAAKTFFPEEVQRNPSMAGKDFLKIFPAEAMATLIGTSYYYRKAKQLAAEDEWTHYSKNIHYQTDLGGFLGLVIPRIGLGKGVLVGAIDTIALTCFHLHDKKGFTEYRRLLKNKNVREELTHEQDRWGCTRYHVGGILLQALGLGIEFSNNYAVGLLASDANEKLLQPDAYTFRISRVWLESLMKNSEAPDRAMRVEYYPEAVGLKRLQTVAANLKNRGSEFSWLDKLKTSDSGEIEEGQES